MNVGEGSNLPRINVSSFIISPLDIAIITKPNRVQIKSFPVSLRNRSLWVKDSLLRLNPSDFRIMMPRIIRGVKMPSPATINQNRIDSCPLVLLKYGIKYLVNKYINSAAKINIENEERNPSLFNVGF